MAITSLWVDKYRPNKIDTIIFQDNSQEAQFREFVKKQEIPNILLYGVQGTGKSTISHVLLSELSINPLDVLKIKCSDEKIEALREKVRGFANTYPIGRFKVVQLEEMDHLSLDAQALLRNLIEDSSETCRFIATCNYVNKIMPPVRSRFQEFKFRAPDQDEIAIRAAEILEAEGISFELENILDYVAAAYPDIRKTIQLLQSFSVGGKLQPIKDVSGDVEWKVKVMACLKNRDFAHARQIICDSATSEEMQDIYRFLYENVEKIFTDVKSRERAIVIIADYLYKHSIVADVEINIAAMLIELSFIGND